MTIKRCLDHGPHGPHFIDQDDSWVHQCPGLPTATGDELPTQPATPPRMATTTPLAHGTGIAAWEYGRRRAELDAGMPLEELIVAELSVEQEIRARALHHASSLLAGCGLDDDFDAEALCDEVLAAATRFAAYITGDATPPTTDTTEEPVTAPIAVQD